MSGEFDVRLIVLADKGSSWDARPGLPMRTLQLLTWLFFVVCFGCIPILLDYLVGHGDVSSLSDAIRHGELVLLAAVLAAGSVGEVFLAILRDNKSFVVLKLLTGSFNALLFAVTGMYYATRRYAGDGAGNHVTHIAHVSIVLFVCAVFAGALTYIFADSR